MFSMKKTVEGLITIVHPEGKLKKSDVVFYNPEMRFNRDISVLALSAFAQEKKQNKHKVVVADVLAASGIRALRYAKEVDGVDEIIVNDISPTAVKIIKKNFSSNKIRKKIKMLIANVDANHLLSKFKYGIDFIDIDPFGSPIQFLDSAARAVSVHGLLGVTATDTAPLSGTYPEKCLIRYGSRSMHGELGHEVGMRILIKNIILECAKYEKAFVPALSFADKHYFRIIGKVLRGKKLLKDAIGKIGYLVYCKNCKARWFATLPTFECSKCKNKENFDYAGQLFTGKLFDSHFISKMYEICDEEAYFADAVFKFLEIVKKESKVDGLTYDLHELLGGTSSMPTTKEVLEKLKKNKIKAAVSHYAGHVIRAEKFLFD